MASVETSITSGAIASNATSNITLTYPSSNKAFYVENISVALDSAPPSGNTIVAQITLKPQEGSNYNVLLNESNLTLLGTSNFLYLPDTPILCKSGDTIEIKVTNNNTSSRTAYVRIVSRLA